MTGSFWNEEPHKELQNYVHDLLTIYKKYPALYAGDNNPEGFEWINADDGDRSIFSFVRKSPTKRNNILYIANFTPVDRPDYRVGVPKKTVQADYGREWTSGAAKDI